MTPSSVPRPRPRRSVGPGTGCSWRLTILFWAAFVIVLGKDTCWDFRNYHWYIPYAFLNDRMGIDVAVAHQASYYNPFLDIPFYWLATHTHAWFALGVLGVVQGANVVPLYLIARDRPAHRRPQARRRRAGAARPDRRADAHPVRHHLLRQCDERVRAVGPRHPGRASARRWRTGRLRNGGAVARARRLSHRHAPIGLKLPEMPFAIGFAAALMALGGRLQASGDAADRRRRSAACWASRCSAACWMLHMEQLTGNPLFPYFNEYWHSPLALAAPYRDMRFLPTHFWRAAVLSHPVLDRLACRRRSAASRTSASGSPISP